jgi:hypothetical protein
MVSNLPVAMPNTLTGRCACGAVRYTASAAPIAMLNCHCRDCQRASGTAFSSIVLVPTAALVIEGSPKFHASTADSGNTVRRAFCPECGSPLFSDSAASAAATAIKAASLDDPGIFKPMFDIWTASACPWVQMDPSTIKVPQNPPMARGGASSPGADGPA